MVSKSQKADSKFTGNHLAVKLNMRRIRLTRKMTIGAAASMIGLTRKKYEDCECIRASGCYFEVELMLQIACGFEISLTDLLLVIPESMLDGIHNGYFLDYTIAPPCPFCGGNKLGTEAWSGEGGEEDATYCKECMGSAPSKQWGNRALVDHNE